ncbi:MAG: histidine phosphatase family protein [Planctomycetes bacterium]|nr:histidine phosphatase family protein [Planctomycetota bacterium]
MTCNIYIVRHGRTEWNQSGIIQGWMDSKLDDLGRRQAEKTAEFIASEGIEKIYASDLSRARETAEIIVRTLEVPLTLSQGLREQHLGDFEGQPWEDLKKNRPEEVAKFVSDFDFVLKGGESRRTMWSRVLAEYERIAEESDGNTVAIVTHGGPILTLVYHVLGIPYGKTKRFRTSNAGVSLFEYSSNDWMLCFLNATTHLGNLPGGHDW